ncbi:MAG: hypothetical protein Q9160_004388 [Pyrenula sp. 1 TL-2023]
MNAYPITATSSTNLEAQSRFVVKLKAVRDAGGDTSQMFLYPPGTSEAEKTKIWKERKKAEKEAKKRAETGQSSEDNSLHGFKQDISGSGEDKNEPNYWIFGSGKEAEATESYSGISNNNEEKKGSRFKRMKGLFSRKERKEHVVH